MDTETYNGIGRRERRRMVRRWREETGGTVSLKQWAKKQHPVGDAATAWINGKRGRA